MSNCSALLGVICAMPTSPSGATLAAAGQRLVDGSLNVWSLAANAAEGPGLCVFMNGAVAGVSYNVATLLFFNNNIYQQNSSGGWWQWNYSAKNWGTQLTGDPRPAGPPVVTSRTFTLAT